MKAQYYQALDTLEDDISEYITLHTLRPGHLEEIATFCEDTSWHGLENLTQNKIIRVKMLPLLVEGLNSSPTIFTLTLNFDPSVNNQPFPIIQTKLKLFQYHLWARETLRKSMSPDQLVHTCKIMEQHILRTIHKTNKATAY